MAGIKALSKIQLGDETVKGTAVAASAIWRGLGRGKDSLEVIHAEEDVGYLMGIDRTYIPKLLAEIEFSEIEATYEQLPYILEAGVESETPTQDGAGSDYIYTYNFPTTAQRTIRTYTIEYGDNQQAEEAAYCFVKEFKISGAAGEAIKMSANWVGRQNSTTSYTGALSLPAVEEILFGNAKLYIDGTGTFPATTQKTSTFISMELNVTTGHQEVFTGDGNLYFTFDKQIMPEVTLQVTFEHDGTAVAEIAAWRAETARSIRIEVTGSTVATPGTTYSNKQLFIDLVGKWESFTELNESDGNNIVTGTLRARYEGTAATAGRLIIVNELSALP